MLRTILGTAGFIALASAFAPAVRADTFKSPLVQPSLVEATCNQVMGLRPGETYFAACQQSLSASLAAKLQGQSLVAAENICQRRGFAPGTAAFSTCTLDTQRTSRIASSSATTPIYASGENLEAGKSFYDVSPMVRWNRERYACANLGLIPGNSAFGECVSSLDGSFLPNPN